MVTPISSAVVTEPEPTLVYKVAEGLPQSKTDDLSPIDALMNPKRAVQHAFENVTGQLNQLNAYSVNGGTNSLRQAQQPTPYEGPVPPSAVGRYGYAPNVWKKEPASVNAPASPSLPAIGITPSIGHRREQRVDIGTYGAYGDRAKEMELAKDKFNESLSSSGMAEKAPPPMVGITGGEAGNADSFNAGQPGVSVGNSEVSTGDEAKLKPAGPIVYDYRTQAGAPPLMGATNGTIGPGSEEREQQIGGKWTPPAASPAPIFAYSPAKNPISNAGEIAGRLWDELIPRSGFYRSTELYTPGYAFNQRYFDDGMFWTLVVTSIATALCFGWAILLPILRHAHKMSPSWVAKRVVVLVSVPVFVYLICRIILISASIDLN
jgi:hypothetical protein